MVSVRGDSIIGIVVALLVLAILIWNVIYIAGVRRVISSGTDIGLSKSGADILFWINIILIVLVAIFLIYNIWVVATTREQRATIQESVTQTLTRPRGDAGLVQRRTTVSGPTPETVIPEVRSPIRVAQ